MANPDRAEGANLKSMTAYATRQGSHGAFSWVWDMRGVNGKGLDVRVRVPDWISGLEAALRPAVTQALSRGNIQVSLKVQRADGDAAIGASEAALKAALEQIKALEALADAEGLALAPSTATDVLNLRSLTEAAKSDDGGQPLADAVRADIAPLLEDFTVMRAQEGAALAVVIDGQLSHIARLVAEAKGLLPDRAAAQAEAFRAGLARILGEAEVDSDKVAHELAQLAIKSDVMEEIDRLEAHISAARVMLASTAPSGRKLDFLMQEFNREANTLCSKSGDSALTRIGLDLKVAIDQMREQIQNVE